MRMPQTEDDIVLERRFRATLDQVWDLWTTARGMESWWGPQGFGVTVVSLDLRPGGELVYLMEARAPEMVAFMKANGMPVATRTVIRYSEVTPPNRLVFRNKVDFVPGVTPYETLTTLDLRAEGGEVVLRLTTGRMHDAEWSERARMGWEQELGKLEAQLARERS